MSTLEAPSRKSMRAVSVQAMAKRMLASKMTPAHVRKHRHRHATPHAVQDDACSHRAQRGTTTPRAHRARGSSQRVSAACYRVLRAGRRIVASGTWEEGAPLNTT